MPGNQQIRKITVAYPRPIADRRGGPGKVGNGKSAPGRPMPRASWRGFLWWQGAAHSPFTTRPRWAGPSGGVSKERCMQPQQSRGEARRYKKKRPSFQRAAKPRVALHEVANGAILKRGNRKFEVDP